MSQGLEATQRPSRQGLMGRQCTSACPALPIREAKRGGSLVCSILGYGRLICRSGSRGRPGLLRTRKGERSEPERSPSDVAVDQVSVGLPRLGQSLQFHVLFHGWIEVATASAFSKYLRLSG